MQQFETVEEMKISSILIRSPLNQLSIRDKRNIVTVCDIVLFTTKQIKHSIHWQHLSCFQCDRYAIMI